MDWRGKKRVKRTNTDEAIFAMTGTVDASGQICVGEFQDQSIVWTNEKHNLYIESLEATFVQQLHQSFGMSSRNFPAQPFVNTFDSSDKFSMRKDGCRKMLQPSSKLHTDKTNNKISNNQCVRNVRSAGKYSGGSLPSFNGKNPDNVTIFGPEQLEGHYESYQLSRGNAEFSDQNFIDEQQMTNQSLNEWQWKNSSVHDAT